MKYLRARPTSVGVWQTFVVLAAIYFVFMMGGAFGYRAAAARLAARRAGRRRRQTPTAMITQHHVHLSDALEDAAVLAALGRAVLNVSAGIGVIGMASPMLQEIFGGRLIGRRRQVRRARRPSSRRRSPPSPPASPACSVLFNIGGRFFWASLSDRIGRKMTYFVFFVLGIALYAAAPVGRRMSAAWRCSCWLFCIILSMYGGGFATMPAYLADLFGTQFVGAIHGRLLTAWSTAGILGPVLVNYIREYQIDAGVPRAQVYNSPCTSWPACWWWASSATSLISPSIRAGS